MKKELNSQTGYDRYFKRLSSLHRAALELFFTSASVPLKIKHTNKKKLNKPDFIHSILAWVSIDIF